jgi:hypothetical protein
MTLTYEHYRGLLKTAITSKKRQYMINKTFGFTETFVNDRIYMFSIDKGFYEAEMSLLSCDILFLVVYNPSGYLFTVHR